MSEELYELPEGWKWIELGELLSFVGSGITPKGGQKVYQSSGVAFIRSQNVYPGGLRLDDVAYVTPELHEKMSRTHLHQGDVLLNITGASIGRSTIVPDWLGPANVNQHVCILRPREDTAPKYLSLFLNSGFGQDQIMEAQSGVTRQGLNYSQLRAITVPLAPFPEQRRIIEKIERLFEQSRTAREALDGVPALLKRFRQSVLASAFRGELTERDPNDEPASVLLERIRAERCRKREQDLRAKGKDPKKAKYVEPEPLDTSDLPELPEGWVWASLAQLSWDAGYGTSQKCSYELSSFPVLRIPNIVKGGFDLTDLKYASATERVDTSNALEPGDWVIVRTNGSKDLIGRGALVRKPFERPHFFASYLIRFRIVGVQGIAEWLDTIWPARPIREWIEQIAASSAGQYNVSVGRLDRLPVPLPPNAEQRRIVAKVESLFAQADAVKRGVEVARRRAEKVDQAILARAFRGEL